MVFTGFHAYKLDTHYWVLIVEKTEGGLARTGGSGTVAYDATLGH